MYSGFVFGALNGNNIPPDDDLHAKLKSIRINNKQR
jgi:hypothetical protein